jgi:hypothetical protein
MANNQQSLITDSNFLWSWGKTHDPQKTQQMAKYDTALELWIHGSNKSENHRKEAKAAHAKFLFNISRAVVGLS